MRPETSSSLTLEEHRELSREIRAARARLHQLCNVVVDVYGSNNHAAFTFLRITDAMDRLCQDLQTQVTQDYPGYYVDDLYL
jgi:polysaccharide deacetylase 2 family uncharacterized protein YibQ